MHKASRYLALIAVGSAVDVRRMRRVADVARRVDDGAHRR